MCKSFFVASLKSNFLVGALGLPVLMLLPLWDSCRHGPVCNIHPSMALLFLIAGGPAGIMFGTLGGLPLIFIFAGACKLLQKCSLSGLFPLVLTCALLTVLYGQGGENNAVDAATKAANNPVAPDLIRHILICGFIASGALTALFAYPNIKNT